MSDSYEIGKRIRRTVDHVERTSRNPLPPIKRPFRGEDGDYTNGNDGSTTGGGNCQCGFVNAGSQSILGGTNNAPNKLVIDTLGFLGTNIELTYDGGDTYISDDIEHDCSEV